MALFKIAKGVSANLPAATTEGYAYFTTDKGEFYIDTATSTNSASTARTMVNGIAYIVGESCNHAGAWTAYHDGLQIRDGLAIIYKVGIDGSNSNEYSVICTNEEGAEIVSTLSYTCLNLNNTGWNSCYLAPQKLLKDEFKEGSILLLVYDASLGGNVGGWMVIGNQLDAETLNGYSTTQEIDTNDPDKIPTAGAVVNYVKSLSYDGAYDRIVY